MLRFPMGVAATIEIDYDCVVMHEVVLKNEDAQWNRISQIE